MKPKIVQDLDGFLSDLDAQKSKPLPRLLLRVGKVLRLLFEPHARFILGQGDVYLQRMDGEGNTHPVEDCLGNPLVLPEQTWLLFYGYLKEDAQKLLESVSALDWEEVIYDWQTLEVQGNRIIGPVLLDRVAGACFGVYRRLVEYVYAGG
jgi:DEAD/DEAH box helicase domain-containing protein